MAERTVRAGKHEFKIASVALTDGGFTATISYIKHERDGKSESRVESGLRHESEDEALSAGEETARLMAENVRD